MAYGCGQMVVPVWMPMGPSRVRLQSPSQLEGVPAQRPRRASEALAAGPEIVVLVARTSEDGRSLIAAVRRGASVLLDTRGLPPERAQRLVDYCTGGVLAMDGQAHRAGPNAFLFAPALARVSAAAAGRSAR